MSFMSNQTEFQYDFPRRVTQVVKVTFNGETQYDRKYDRFCKLTIRKIIQRKMSIGVHNPLGDF